MQLDVVGAHDPNDAGPRLLLLCVPKHLGAVPAQEEGVVRDVGVAAGAYFWGRN